MSQVSSLLGVHSRLQDGWTHLASFQFDKADLSPSGKVTIAKNELSSDCRVKTKHARYHYVHNPPTLTVQSDSDHIPPCTFEYDERSWWAKLHDREPTPYAHDLMDAFDLKVTWTYACIDAVHDGATSTPFHDIGPL